MSWTICVRARSRSDLACDSNAAVRRVNIGFIHRRLFVRTGVNVLCAAEALRRHDRSVQVPAWYVGAAGKSFFGKRLVCGEHESARFIIGSGVLNKAIAAQPS